jgi:2,3-bisphosphoglycerate-independent phosphoglycerate mutase
MATKKKIKGKNPVKSKSQFNRARKQVVLAVLDGWGYREEKKDNGIANAHTPNFNRLVVDYPHTLLEASGRAVGLPDGQIGNSDVGHTTIGAGTTVFTDLVRITDSFKKKEFEKIPTVKKLFAHVKKNKSALHVIGLLGPGGVHASGEHLTEFLRVAKKVGMQKVYLHTITDGRDAAIKAASKDLKELEVFIEKNKIGFIVSMIGRYFAMDRDNNWDRLAKAEELLFAGKGELFENRKASDIAASYYEKNMTDEHFQSTVFADAEGKIHSIAKNDGVIFLNFRADRARMLSKKILEKKKKLNLFFATMTQYDSKLKTEVIFKPTKIETTLAKEIAKAKLSQTHIAETEKFAHATYFLNGGVEKPYPKEKHILLDSRKDVATHDLAPEMKAKEIADATIKEIEKGTSFIFLNIANADMVGHTANKDAIQVAIESADRELGRIAEVAEKNGAILLVTADHGNAEINIDPITGEKHTAHTTSLVPMIVTDKHAKLTRGKLSLAGIAPAVLKLLGLKIPKVMDGKNIIQ